MANLPSIDLGWLGGGVGGLMRPGRATNEGGSSFGGQRTALKDFFEGSARATDEQFKSDSVKSRSLRAYLSKLDPTQKDRFTSMGLEDLEGYSMGLAEERMKERDNLRSQQEYLQMLETSEGLNERRQGMADRQAGQAAAGRFLQAYATQPPESLQAPGYDPQSAALAAAGPDLARGANLGALMPYLPRPENPVDRMNAEAAMLHGRANLANAEANQQRSLFGPAGTGGTAAEINQFDRMDYQQTLKELAALNEQFTKETNLDNRNMLVGRINAAKKRLAQVRGGQGQAPAAAAPAAAPAPAAPTMRFGIVNGQLVPIK